MINDRPATSVRPDSSVFGAPGADIRESACPATGWTRGDDQLFGVLGGWQRVGKRIREARARRGYRTVAEFAAACQLSESTIRDLETGRRANYKASTISRVQAELGWLEGSIMRTVEGRRPILAQDEQLQAVTDAWPQLSREMRRVIFRMVRDALDEQRSR